MTNTTLSMESRPMKVASREIVVKMLQAALESGEYRFARQTAISWLAAFPGDLEVIVLQSKAVIAEGKPAQVISALDLVCRKDPLYLPAYRALAWASREVDPAHYQYAITAAFVLGEQIPPSVPLEGWGKPLKEAWTLIENQQYQEALTHIDEALEVDSSLLLAQAFQLLAFRALKEPQEFAPIAQDFYSRNPDCLLNCLALAEAYLQQGNEFEAVRLLHLGASGDSLGQVARRLWGEDHPYRSLWPEDMVIHFDQPVPSGVAGRLGWNRLPAGENLMPEAPAEDAKIGEAATAHEKTWEPDPKVDTILAVLDRIANLETRPVLSPVSGEDTAEACDPLVSPVERISQDAGDGQSTPAGTGACQGIEEASENPEPKDETVKLEEAASVQKSVEVELEKLAQELHQPSLARADGRFPVYVIFTTRNGLEDQYGPQTKSVIDAEMRHLAAVVARRKGWQSIVYYADDPAFTNQYGLEPANPQDPWKLKHALVDLDAALSKRGEMIGALLIVGGDTVVPFHHLPNPTEDSDLDVPSDSPYATLDSNYFIPEWPVGRLPGEAGPDSGTLLEQIRQVEHYHAHRVKGKMPFGKEWIIWIKARIEDMAPNRSPHSFGYTAAVWRRSSLAVFRPIGAPHTVLASPPAFSGGLKRKVTANLGYYNLHGLEDSPVWYGQRDPLEAGAAPDYPVALSPEDLHRNGRSPKFVFSEACYGGHVFGKTEKDSLALKFISIGTLGMVASTCVSYGSVSTPLIGADLLGHLFWQQLKSGKTAGEALMIAKVQLVREMNRRQGYLDGEDQKTLISFLLYGDPLAGYDGFRVRSKGIARSKEHPIVRTTSEESQEVLLPGNVPAGVIKEVKQVVAEYLPGADVAGIRFCRLRMDHLEKEPPAGGAYLSGRKSGKDASGRLVVTVSKQVQVAQHLHCHYMHVTMDDAGKMLKVALSR